MNIFLSHARKDAALARALAERLISAGFQVWSADEEIAPGDNWAKKIGKALDDSDLMLILLTPKAFDSDSLQQDIDFALGSRKYEDRVYSVFVGPTAQAARHMPWILLKLPHRLIESEAGFGDVVSELQARCTASSGH